MALTRGSIIGYNSDRMMFEFTMTDDERLVACQISSIAMDYMDGARGTPPVERKAQFVRLRDAIERIAADIFKVEGAVHVGIVRIFQKHLTIGRTGKPMS